MTARRLEEWGFPALGEQLYQVKLLRFAALGWDSPELNEECLRYFRGLKGCPEHFSLKRRCMYRLLCLSPGLYRWAFRSQERLRQLYHAWLKA